MKKWLSLITLLALAGGLLAGAAISGQAGPEALAIQFGYIGELWLNLLRMTVIPLVFALLVTGVASVASAAATGRLAARAVMVFGVLLVSATTFACLVFPFVLMIWPVDPSAVSGLIAQAAGEPVEAIAPPTLGEWAAALAPSNVIAAAARGEILPLVVFAILFGFAATQLPEAQRAPMVGFFKAVSDTMIVIVRWVLLAAPLGVFALALGVGLTAGVGIVGLIAHYILVVSGVTALIVPLAFLFAWIWGGVSPARFFAAAGPVLAVAMSSRSSLASLPLMVERSRAGLGVPDGVAGVVLPLAVAIFRMTSPVANLGVIFFCAAVFDVDLGVTELAVGGFVAIAISVGSVGLPGEISFVASVAPIAMSMGVPIELLGLLVAVEAIPDIFRTVGNVSGDMAAAVIAGKTGRSPPAQEAGGAPPG